MVPPSQTSHFQINSSSMISLIIELRSDSDIVTRLLLNDSILVSYILLTSIIHPLQILLTMATVAAQVVQQVDNVPLLQLIVWRIIISTRLQKVVPHVIQDHVMLLQD